MYVREKKDKPAFEASQIEVARKQQVLQTHDCLL